MAPFESLDTVSYSHSIATMGVSLAVLTQYTNVTRHPASQTDRHTTQWHRTRLCIALRGKKSWAVTEFVNHVYYVCNYPILKHTFLV